MGNVIDLRSRAKAQSATSSEVKNQENPAQVIDLDERKSQAPVTKERRKTERTVLSEFITVHVIVPNQGLLKVALYDMTTTGLSFDLDERFGQFQKNESVAMRVYLNRQTYFPFTVEVRHVRKVDDEGVYRHGAQFSQESVHNEALHYLAKFLETVSESLRRDSGDKMISNMNS